MLVFVLRNVCKYFNFFIESKPVDLRACFFHVYCESTNYLLCHIAKSFKHHKCNHYLFEKNKGRFIIDSTLKYLELIFNQ